jgi:hypothetical protein
MSINLRVVGVFFQQDIALSVTPTTSIKDVMDAAQLQFPGFSYETATGSPTLYKVSNKVAGVAEPYVLRDADRKTKPVKPGVAFQTWQSYIIRGGLAVGIDGVFVPFGQRIVEDGDSVIWRLVSIVKK